MPTIHVLKARGYSSEATRPVAGLLTRDLTFMFRTSRAAQDFSIRNAVSYNSLTGPFPVDITEEEYRTLTATNRRIRLDDCL